MNILNSAAVNVAKKNIKRYGKQFIFYRPALNKYKEKTNAVSEIANVKGLFHTGREAVVKILQSSDAGKISELETDAILCEKNQDIQTDDFCYINDIKYYVSGIYDFDKESILMNISLREERS